MSKILQVKSTLTDRYQTTIPEAIREALHLGKRDQITYEIDANGKVILSRTSEEDPVLNQFLLFIVKDIQKHPDHVCSINSVLLERAQSLVTDVEVDLDSPLLDKDE